MDDPGLAAVTVADAVEALELDVAAAELQRAQRNMLNPRPSHILQTVPLCKY